MRFSVQPRVLPLVLLLALPFAAAAQDIVPDPEPPPPAGRPAACAGYLSNHYDGELDPRIASDCDSSAFYFGIGRPQDFPSARACAYIERFQHVDKDGSLFTGAGILSMVYANGEGTERDLDRARRFVCENKEASNAEIEKRLALIDKIAANPAQAPHFDLCSTSTTGESWGWCTTIQLRQHDAKRYDEMVALVEKMNPQAQEAFKALQTAEGAFEAMRTDKEVDQTGTARGAWILQEQDRIRAQFVSDLKLFNSPNFSEPVSLAVADAHLTADYEALRANGPRLFRDTTLTVAGVDATQQAWLKYRAAWVAFEAIADPGISADAVATQITRERLYHIHKLSTP